jgi:D-glycero-D-manno-heptose 1,7-bisphosphate phosphatase
VGIASLTPRIPAIFLDRDGILNRALVREGRPRPPVGLAELELLPWTLTSLPALRAAGYLLVGITNQPDVARGRQTRAGVEALNAWIQERLPVEEIFVCYHDDDDQCDCRKPKPGLIFQAARKYGLDLTQSWMLGDRWKDIAAGQAAGVSTIFVDYHYDEAYRCPPATFVVGDTLEIERIILKGST